MSERQRKLLHFIATHGTAFKEECARHLNVSGDTALRELTALMQQSLIVRTGTGKATRYNVKSG